MLRRTRTPGRWSLAFLLACLLLAGTGMVAHAAALHHAARGAHAHPSRHGPSRAIQGRYQSGGAAVAGAPPAVLQGTVPARYGIVALAPVHLLRGLQSRTPGGAPLIAPTSRRGSILL
jgi:hypothetical protein